MPACWSRRAMLAGVALARRAPGRTRRSRGEQIRALRRRDRRSSPTARCASTRRSPTTSAIDAQPRHPPRSRARASATTTSTTAATHRRRAASPPTRARRATLQDDARTARTSTCASAIPTRRSPACTRYRIDYTVRGALLTFADHDELYWDAIGNQWPVPIQNVRVTVHAPADDHRVACFAGPAGQLACRATGAADVGHASATFAQPTLGPCSGLTIVVAHAQGHDPAPARSRSSTKRRTLADAFAVTPVTVGLGGGLALLGLGVRRAARDRRGRDRRYTARRSTPRWATSPARRSAIPLFGRRRGPGRVRAARRHPARPGRHARRRAGEPARRHRVDRRSRGARLAHDHRARARRRTSATPTTSSRRRPSKGKGELLAVRAAAAATSCSDRPDREALRPQVQVPRRASTKIQTRCTTTPSRRAGTASGPTARGDAWRRSASLVIVVGVGLTCLVAATTSFGLVPLAIVVTGIVLLARRGTMPARTGKGSAMLSRVRGFRRLFDEGEEDTRARFAEQHDIFSQYLPYAIVFGCTKKWAKAFEGIDAEQLRRRAGTSATTRSTRSCSRRAMDDFGTTATGTMYASMPSSSSRAASRRRLLRRWRRRRRRRQLVTPAVRGCQTARRLSR